MPETVAQILAIKRVNIMKYFWQFLITDRDSSDSLALISKDINQRTVGSQNYECTRTDFFLHVADGGCTPLMLAVFAWRNDVVQALLSLGADANAVEPRGNYTAFLIAILAKNHAAVQLLLGHGSINLNAQLKKTGETAIHLLIKQNQVGLIKTLIAHGADGCIPNKEMRTPLYCTCESGFEDEVVEALLECGTDCEIVDYDGRSPLLVAILEGENSVVKRLLAGGANANVAEADGDGPLHIAAHAGNIDAITLFLRLGMNPNAGNNIGDTPFHKAIAASRENAAKVLVAHGANVNAKNMAGRAPYHIATNLPRMRSMNYLNSLHEADVNAVDNNGDTPLHYAARSLPAADTIPIMVHLFTIDGLKNAGADCTILNKQGKSAYNLFENNSGALQPEHMLKIGDMLRPLMAAAYHCNGRNPPSQNF